MIQRIALRCLALSLFALLLQTGCGIDSFSFLYAPDSDFVVEPLLGETEFKYDHNINNSSNNFLGYELYYKFYTTDQESVLQSDRSSIEGSSVPGIARLVSRGYRRVSRIDGQRPIIDVPVGDKGLDFVITIDVGVDPNPTVYFSLYGAPRSEKNLVRQVIEEGETDPIDKGFLGADIDEGDSDVPSAYLEGEPIDLAVFVIAYGIDIEILIEIYSDPTYLGSVRI